MIYNTTCPVVVSRLKDHDQIKDQLLKLIDQMPGQAIKNDDGLDDVISKTDWNLSEDSRELYLEFVRPLLVDHIFQEFKKFDVRGIDFGNFWFQQYNHLDTHDWHIHGKCHWTNVYFLELPNSDLKTEIQNFNNSGLIEYEAVEGDVISFPAMLYHRSPVNNTNLRKTIISFNTNYI
jgi:hypothetical protein